MTGLEELRRLIDAHCSESHCPTAIPGLTLLRAESKTPVPVQVIYSPMVCLIAQGRKQVHLAQEAFDYDAASYLVSSVHLPVSGRVIEATRKKPYLALSLALDAEMLSGLLLEMPSPSGGPTIPLGLAVTAITPELLDAFVRLLRLLGRAHERPLLAPLIVREILFRLLAGEQAPMLRQVALRDSRTQPVMRVINWIREHYARPFSMSELLQVAHMSAPSLHRHFKAVTAMSPLQYQKQIRLQEARRILVAEQQDAATVGFTVGYGSPSQFSREYCRLFGARPCQDAERLLKAASVWPAV